MFQSAKIAGEKLNWIKFKKKNVALNRKEKNNCLDLLIFKSLDMLLKNLKILIENI